MTPPVLSADVGRPGPRLRVVYFAHGHPAVRPFGAEADAGELYAAARRSADIDAYLVARVEPGEADALPRSSPGSPLRVVPGDDHQFQLEVRGDDFDSFYQTLRDQEVYARWL